MNIGPTIIEDEFAEGFRMWACRLIVTAADDHWLDAAVREVTGYGASVIGCDAEAGRACAVTADAAPDGRGGAALLFFAFNAKALAKAMPNRVGQCLMTCPTTAVFDGMPDVVAGEDAARLDMGATLRYFGDGFQKSKRLESPDGQQRARRFWRVPVMDGEFLCEDTVGCVKAVAGGNFLICGESQAAALAAVRRAVDAIAPLPQVITPFPGGAVRSGSKVGSKYKALFASTNDAYCPTLRHRPKSRLRDGVQSVYEIVINGLTEQDVADAMRIGIEAAAGEGVIAISAGNYGGNLGKFHFHLHDILGRGDRAGGGA